MSIFKYQAENEEGATKSGLTVSVSENEAIIKLRKVGLNAVGLTDVTNTLYIRFLQIIAPIKNKDLVVFARQFSVMISANVPVVESLIVLIDQTNNLSLQNMIASIAFDVESGLLLSDAFSKYPKIFSEFFVNV